MDFAVSVSVCVAVGAGGASGAGARAGAPAPRARLLGVPAGADLRLAVAAGLPELRLHVPHRAVRLRVVGSSGSGSSSGGGGGALAEAGADVEEKEKEKEKKEDRSRWRADRFPSGAHLEASIASFALSPRFVCTGTEIGAGAFARVLLGRDRATGAPTAVKALRVPSEGESHTHLYLEREVGILRELAAAERPNVHLVQTLDIVEMDDGVEDEEDDGDTAAGTHWRLRLRRRLLFVVMEHVAGGSLADVLRARVPRGLTEPEARHVAVQLVVAMRHLAARRIMHRDVKPDNILLQIGSASAGDGSSSSSSSSSSPSHMDLTRATVKLCDFGFSRHYDDAVPVESTPCSPLYGAPEQLLGLPHAGGKVDLFSAGAVLFEALAGRALWAGVDSVHALAAAHFARGAEARLAAEPALRALSPECRDLLAQLLATDPAQRPDWDAVARHPFFRVPGTAPARRVFLVAGASIAEFRIAISRGERDAPGALAAALGVRERSLRVVVADADAHRLRAGEEVRGGGRDAALWAFDMDPDAPVVLAVAGESAARADAGSGPAAGGRALVASVRTRYLAYRALATKFLILAEGVRHLLRSVEADDAALARVLERVHPRTACGGAWAGDAVDPAAAVLARLRTAAFPPFAAAGGRMVAPGDATTLGDFVDARALRRAADAVQGYALRHARAAQLVRAARAALESVRRSVDGVARAVVERVVGARRAHEAAFRRALGRGGEATSGLAAAAARLARDAQLVRDSAPEFVRSYDLLRTAAARIDAVVVSLLPELERALPDLAHRAAPLADAARLADTYDALGAELRRRCVRAETLRALARRVSQESADEDARCAVFSAAFAGDGEGDPLHALVRETPLGPTAELLLKGGDRLGEISAELPCSAASSADAGGSVAAAAAALDVLPPADLRAEVVLLRRALAQAQRRLAHEGAEQTQARLSSAPAAAAAAAGGAPVADGPAAAAAAVSDLREALAAAHAELAAARADFAAHDGKLARLRADLASARSEADARVQEHADAVLAVRAQLAETRAALAAAEDRAVEAERVAAEGLTDRLAAQEAFECAAAQSAADLADLGERVRELEAELVHTREALVVHSGGAAAECPVCHAVLDESAIQAHVECCLLAEVL